MKVPFFAAVLLAAVIYCSAADQECLDRKARNLPLQWGSATDCGTYYRCGPKDGVREMKCPAGKDFVERTGKCEKSGPRTCKLRGKQTPAAVENACDGVTPGSNVADPTFCAQYYFCDGSASGILSSCPSGGYFDATRGNCVADTDSTCWQNKCINEPSGIFLPDSTSCRTYYFCAEGKTTRLSCLAGAYFTPAGNCQPDNDNLCYENYCIGQSNNVLVGNPNSCTGYYRCTDEVAVPLECPEGSYFNVALGACVTGDCPAYTTTPASIDTTTQPPNTEVCCGQPDGAVVPDPDNCYAYYYCKDQLAENVQCEPGYYFDKVDKICALGVCPSDEICTCPGGYENGDIVKHPDNCMLFYICNNGDMVEKTCGYGNYWNPVAEECMLDTDGLCPQSAAPTTTPPTTTPPAAPTGAKLKKKVKPNAQRPKRSIDDIVDSLDEEDVLTPLEKPTEEHADDHEDETNALIERVLPEVAKPALKCLGIYNDGQFVAHPDDCRKFQICYDGDLYEQSCGLGNYFNGALDMCVPDTQNLCPIRPIATVDTTTGSNCTCPGGYSEGQFVPYPGNCSLFYICHETLLLEGSCGEGNLFDNATSACVQDVNNTCWPPAEPCIPADICTGVPDDSALPVPHQCNAFFFCMDNVSTYYQCPEGDYFNANVGICLPDIEATCINPCVNTTGIVTTLPHPDCSMYYLCNNGQTYVQNCTQGYYDVATGVCSTTAVCPTAFCQNQPEYTTFPVEGNTQEFYICIGGVAVLKQCLPGTAFNATVEVCLPAPSASCNQTMCPNNFEAFPTLDGQTNAFCFCKGNDAYLETCPLDYTFNETLGICYSNAPCDPMICLNSPDYTVSVNRNSSDSFCLCVYKQPVIVDCPAGTVFNQYQLLCLPPNAASSNCVPNSCVGVEQNTAISPMPGLTGFCFCQNNEATYYACPQNSVFNPTIGICQSPLPVDQACNASLCATETVFPTVNDPYSFCYCLDNGTVILQRCSDGTQFDPERQVCLQSPCNPDICIGQQNGATFPANNYTFGFCECNNQLPQLVPCLAGQMYSPEREICLAEVDLFCDVALCANATINNPYAVPAINNTSAFCYCTGPNNVMKLDCPSNSTFNATLSICVSDVQAGCTCPGGYADGSFVPHLTDCNAFFICNNGILHEMDCGEGNFFNATNGACQQDVANTCTIAAQTQSTCVGAFKNGDFLPHPLSSRLYYICMDAQLHESDCGPGNHFDAILGHCIGPHSRKVQKRSAPVDELPCIENSKRSVPANCSQYELCIDSTWRRRSCANQRYYNPEQQLCLEPRDDMVCNYAKVTGLPACTNDTELQTYPSKTNNCMQYFVCSHEKWRLKSCSNKQYYSRALRTCIATDDDRVCMNIDGISNTTTAVKQSSNCQHTAVRSYAHNCAMYLMCRENEWWYQHCPPGMYFNHTQNFCMPATDAECPDVVPLANANSGNGTSFENDNDMETELKVLNCTTDGALRPSALACDKYYMCVNGLWQALQCKPQQYFNVAAEACVVDDVGFCVELAECRLKETREFPLNCTAYERCTAGKWQRFNCPKGYAYDLITEECIVNDGYCLPGGLRKACNVGATRKHPIAENCTQFYYCEQDKWHVGTCLKGNTYDAAKATCVPHAINNKCLPLSTTTIIDQINDEQENLICKGKADGVAVQHQEDCSRFHICMNGKPTKEMYCTTGSYFDPKLGYCLPNDGTCVIPLTGACANATDGSYVPHPLDCSAYYHCSTRNGTQLLHCPQGEYYHKFTHQCRIDHGQCHQPSAESKCAGFPHGTLLPHETYCNIYYACVRGLAIPVECPQENVFNDVLGHCVYDVARQCENGHLNGNGMKYSCGNITDGTFLPDRFDCTRYFICTGDEAIPQRCRAGSFFDSQELLCVDDDGSCPYVDDDQPNNQPVPPDPIVCEGKHGNMMADPANCNEFYVCINGKLRHDRCYIDYFFNATSLQCQAYQRNSPGDGGSGNATTVISMDTMKVAASRVGNASKQCTDKPTDYSDLCQQIPEGSSIAEQGDCRRYVTCQDNGPVTLRCRNGESFDSLLGFCRQNDGTCLLENGERVGVCSKHHGQLVRDVDNCRGFFVCINGQRISGECAEDEYFSKSQNMCQKDVQAVCQKTNGEVSSVSCTGLGESVLYPHVQSQCRSYFQCVKGVPKIYECADGLYFNATTTRCVKEISECSMPPTTPTLQRAELERKKPMNKCNNVTVNFPYADLEDNCQTFYVCQSDGTISYEKCPEGKLFSEERGVCIEAKLVRCQPGINF